MLLPLECYTPGVGNTCGTGAFGVADPATLAFRYYVKLDPADIPKAMWAETSPDGSLIWTSSGDDLLAYRSATSPRRIAPPPARCSDPVRRLVGAVPPTGVTGAVFWRGRLLLAGEANGTYQVWAINTDTGKRRLELEMSICGESEGLDVIPTLGGKLHWLIGPFDPGCQLTFGPTSALLHFVPTPRTSASRWRLRTRTSRRCRARCARPFMRRVDGRPLRRARVTFAGATARTDKHGIATVSTFLELPGRFRALARRGQSYGVSDLVRSAFQLDAKRCRQRGRRPGEPRQYLAGMAPSPRCVKDWAVSKEGALVWTPVRWVQGAR